MPSSQFYGDMSAELSLFERVVRDNEVQSRKAVDDDLKMGVVILGMHGSLVKENLIRNTARLDSWIKTRDEILGIAVTQQHINSQPAPMQLGTAPSCIGKGQRKEKGMDKATPPPLQAEMRQPSKGKSQES